MSTKNAMIVELTKY